MREKKELLLGENGIHVCYIIYHVYSSIHVGRRESMARERDSPLKTALHFKMVAAIEAWLDDKGKRAKKKERKAFLGGQIARIVP